MRKTIFAATAAMLLAAPAYAQSGDANSNANANPGSSSPSTGMPSSLPTPSTVSPGAAATPSSSTTLTQMKARDLVGKSVYNQAGERIGEIDDVAINNKTRTTAAVIGVGGFLGIGETKAAVPLSQLQVQGDRVVAPTLTKDDLARLGEYRSADWTPYEADRTLGEAVGQ